MSGQGERSEFQNKLCGALQIGSYCVGYNRNPFVQTYKFIPIVRPSNRIHLCLPPEGGEGGGLADEKEKKKTKQYTNLMSYYALDVIDSLEKIRQKT